MNHLIGEGGYGKVYRSQKTPSVVSKETRLWDEHTRVRDGELYGVNVREAVLLRSINHPGVVRATDVSYTKKNLTVVMEYGGISLNEWIETQGVKRRHHLMGLFTQLVNVVYDLWCMGIQQVDMVPENILVQDADAGADAMPRLRLIDVGLCSFRVHIGEWTDAFGSWLYCPPEVVLMDCVGDATCVWSLAMIAAFMWTGRNPLELELCVGEKASSRRVISHILRHNRDTLWSRSVVNGGMPPEWGPMFDRMTEWREGRRMTMEEVHAAINKVHVHRGPTLGIPVALAPHSGTQAAEAEGPFKAIVAECTLTRPQRRMFPYAHWLWGELGGSIDKEKEVAVACLAWAQLLTDSLDDRIVRGWCETTGIPEVVVAQTMLDIAERMQWRMIQI